MRSKIYFPEQRSETFEEVYTSFIISQTSKGVAATTIRNYHLHLKSVSKYLDIGMPFCRLTKRHLESMVVSMRAAGLAHNTVATYLRVINTFLNWASREGLTSVSIPNIKEKDTVKETYTDAELLILLKKPEKKCDFTEYRNWVIINYLLNAGCRAATVRNIQNRDVDGQRGYHTKLLVGELCKSEECAQILRGWIMSNDSMPLGERVHTIGRINVWGSSPVTSKKRLDEIKILQKYFSDEKFCELDKKLRCIRRD